MKTRKAKYLLDAHPQLFSTFIERYKQPEHQFSVGDGWYPIISDICVDILKLRVVSFWNKNAMLAVDVSQMKEKFGTLRFYYTMDIHNESNSSIRFRKIEHWIGMKLCKWGFHKQHWAIHRFRRKYIYETLYEKVGTIVARGEAKSAKTCEVCGGEGKGCSPTGWRLTLCEKHEKEASN
jgi:hypothetical protein